MTFLPSTLANPMVQSIVPIDLRANPAVVQLARAKVVEEPPPSYEHYGGFCPVLVGT